MSGLRVEGVSVALGSIQDDLGAGVIPLQWVLNAYSLVFASLMLIAGTLPGRVAGGRRRPSRELQGSSAAGRFRLVGRQAAARISAKGL